MPRWFQATTGRLRDHDLVALAYDQLAFGVQTEAATVDRGEDSSICHFVFLYAGFMPMLCCGKAEAVG